MEMIGQLLDRRYRIVQVLSSGAFGQTYLSADTRRPGHPQCVVKQLRPPNNNSNTLKTALRLFRQEAEILERLGKHDQIPQLLAYFEDHNQFYLIEEFVSGQPLMKELVPGVPWSEEQVILLIEDILEILVFVHDNQVILRDVNPSNLIRRKSDKKLVLIDFGSVKEVSSRLADGNGQGLRTIATGTPFYMPIEQFQGHPQYNSDIYAVGMIAIQAITGLEASDLPKLQDPNLSSTGEPSWQSYAKVSAGLTQVIDRMVHPYYSKRYLTVIDVLDDLRKATGRSGFNINKLKSFPIYQEEKKPIPWPKIIAITTTGLVSLIVIFGLLQVLNRPDPVKAENALKRGVEKVNQGDPKGAIRAFNQAIKFNPNNPEAYHKRANAYYDLKEYEQALADYTKAIELNPKYVNAYFNRGLTRYDMSDLSGALADFNQVLKQEPQDGDAFYKRGLIHYDLEDYTAAINDYNTVLRLQPKESKVYRARGTALVKSGDLQAGMADYTEAIRLEPKNPIGYYDRGRARFHLGDYQGALADYNTVLQIDPNNSEAYANRCSVYINLWDYDQAIKDCTEAINRTPNEVAYNNRCIANLNLKDYPKAIEDCSKAIEIKGDDYKAYSNRGLARSAAQDYEGAIADYTQGININPNDAEAYGNRAQVHVRMKNYDKAIADYAQAIRLKPNYAAAYYGRGLVRVEIGDKSGAISDFEQAGKLYLEQGLTGGYKDAQFQIKRLQSGS